MAGMKDVADAAGVSTSTVSRVLNGKSYVNEETRRKVLDAVEKTKFRPNALAKSLKIGRSNTICLMVPSIENLMIPMIVHGAEDTARKSGFSVILCNTDEDEALEKSYIEIMKTRLTDGFIFCSAYGDEHRIYELHEQGFPLVMVNRFQPEDVGRLETITVDNYRAGYTATAYLIRTGHRRIALAYGREELYLYRERYRGYCDALKDGGVAYDEALVMREVTGTDDFYQLTRRLMELPEPPDAVFASSDPKAFVVMRALHDLGKRIPEDVAVMGFDNVAMASMVEPPLSTMAQPFYEMGCAAAKSLIRQISYKDEHGQLPPVIHSIMGCDLLIRRSTN